MKRYTGSKTSVLVPNQNSELYDGGGFENYNFTNFPFAFNNNVEIVNLNDVPFTNNSAFAAFYGCQNLTTVTNINSNVTDLLGTFTECSNLENISSIPNTVTNMYYAFYNCQKLETAPAIPELVTNMSRTFVGCEDLSGNVYINSEDITNAYYCFGQTSGIKEVYIPFNTTQQHIITKWYCWKNSNDVSYYTKTDFYNITQGTSEYRYEQLYNDAFVEDGGLEYRNNGEPTYERYYYDVESGEHTYETMTYSSADNIVITKEIGDSSLTYDAFVEAGYSENERKDGVLLHDINSL